MKQKIIAEIARPICVIWHPQSFTMKQRNDLLKSVDFSRFIEQYNVFIFPTYEIEFRVEVYNAKDATEIAIQELKEQLLKNLEDAKANNGIVDGHSSNVQNY